MSRMWPRSHVLHSLWVQWHHDSDKIIADNNYTCKVWRVSHAVSRDPCLVSSRDCCVVYLGKTHLRVYISIGELLRESGEDAGKGGGGRFCKPWVSLTSAGSKTCHFGRGYWMDTQPNSQNRHNWCFQLGTSESSLMHHVTYSHLMAPLLNPVAITLTEIPSGAAENSRQLIMCSHATWPINLPFTVHIFITLPSSTVLSSEV